VILQTEKASILYNPELLLNEMKSGEVTIKDIARQLDISPSTVSRALKDHPDISQKTKSAVLELATELDYHPNSIALSLRKSQTNTIGVIIPEIIHFFFSTIISGIEDVAYNAGYNIILCQSNESYDKEVTDTRALLNSRVDGLLVSCSSETKSFDHFEDLHNRGVPIVFFDRIYDGIDTNRVIVDDYEGARMAVQHLVEIGCTRIAHLAGPGMLQISKSRFQGYKDVIEESGLTYDEGLVATDIKGVRFERGYAITKELLCLPDPPDAIFANQDLAAVGAMKAIKERGLHIPNDIAVVGFSNWQMSSYIEPSLTTVSQPGFQMGQEAVKLFIQQVKEDDIETYTPVTKILKTELIIRDSTKR